MAAEFRERFRDGVISFCAFKIRTPRPTHTTIRQDSRDPLDQKHRIKPVEAMEFIRRSISGVLAVPEICAAHLPSDNSPILIKRGTRGYCLRWEAYDGERSNKHHGVTDAQVEAMLAGSMFGFDCMTPPSQRAAVSGRCRPILGSAIPG